MATHAVPGTGLELILNAAEGVLQIVVTEDEAILCAQEWYRSERATEILAPALAELATSLGIRWNDLRRIACVRGPGSFTGIRLTLATAAALRRCGRAQLAGLDYMQALATTAVMRRGMLYGGHVWVLTHARRNLVHCQPFISYGPEIPAQPLQGVTLCTPAEAVAAITADTADATLVCGT
ncbi:tRNA (adenosine(37)-N6)-threonylcarbamoyltransferase complex dimerization subunit type 1 TsaB, partial [Desulfovibrio sp.]|uniref:tRNA (adenosine(37)-N6)-threonylcarbamoyltransferase complex dimerization subunit type 1 TsaB n=1 Tax=Desulfovibrio sp. TaxID=885 RepID=UPI003AAB650E